MEFSENIRVNLQGLTERNLRLDFLLAAPHPVHRVATCFFRMVHVDTAAELGRINLRLGSSPHIERYAGHVGFFVNKAHRGHRYAARSVRLLAPFAKALGFVSLWITCDPENMESRRSLELAGATLVETVKVPPNCVIFQSGHLLKCRYRLEL